MPTLPEMIDRNNREVRRRRMQRRVDQAIVYILPFAVLLAGILIATTH